MGRQIANPVKRRSMLTLPFGIFDSRLPVNLMPASPKSPVDQRCSNCSEPVDGPFCAHCGQNVRKSQLVPISVWLLEVTSLFLSLDSKLYRTLKRIVFQPGQATLDFAEGRRVPFTSPSKVYIVVSAISIGLMTLLGLFTKEALVIPGIDVDDGFIQRFQLLFPFLNLLSPCVTALVLWGLDRQTYLQIHIAFSLHVWTFVVIVTTLLVLVEPGRLLFLLILGFVSLWIFVYVILAYRTVYETSIQLQAVGSMVVLASVLFAMIVIPFFLYFAAAWTG